MHESILIIDDEPGITIALMIRLQNAGYTVNHAINGLAGVEAAALHRPDLVILDVRMPDVDGFEVFERIRRLPGLTDTPVILLTANNCEDTLQRSLDAGIDAFIAKPFDSSVVLQRVRELLSLCPKGVEDG